MTEGNLLNPGATYLLFFSQPIRVAAQDNLDQFVPSQCLLQVTIQEGSTDFASLSVDQFSLVGSNIAVEGGNTGIYSMQSTESEGQLYADSADWYMDIGLRAEFVYRLLEQELGFEQVSADQFFSSVEIFEGRVRSRLRVREMQGLIPDFEFVDGEIQLNYQEGGLGLVQSITVPLTSSGEPIIFYSANQATAANGSHKRRLKIRPVGFKNRPAGTDVASEPHIHQMFSSAQTIWGKACIELQINKWKMLEWESLSALADLETNDDLVHVADLETSDDLVHVIDLFEDPDPYMIEVFFVDFLLGAYNGAAVMGQQALSRVIISAFDLGNPNLLAHELGHVFLGTHPDEHLDGCWKGEHKTVMEYGLENPERNTAHNCQNAQNPALEPLSQVCVQTPDS